MRTLVEYGLANAAAATALAVLALLIGLVVRAPAIRNALWLLVFVRLLLPPIWTIHLPVPTAEFESQNLAVTPTSPDATADPSPAVMDGPAGELPINWIDGSVGTDPAPVVSDAYASEANVLRPNDPGFRIPDEVCSLLLAIWFTGSALVLARSVRRVYRFRRALGDARRAPDAIHTLAESLARAMGMRRCPEILLVPGRLWPSLWMPGVLPQQAKIILPAGLLPFLDREQLTAVLAHELSHLRRGDPWVRWLELIACVIYWWYPPLGWFRRNLRESEEECCDLSVVAVTNGRKSYATALVETAVFLDGPDRTAAPVLASGAGPVRNLQRRVAMIMRATWPARLTRLGFAVVLGIGGVGLAFGPAVAQERRDPPPRDERPKEPPKERREGPARDRERGRDREIDEARAALEKARQAAREAMERLHDAEVRVARLEGRPLPPAARPGDEGRRGPGDRGGPREVRPGERPPMERGGEDRRPIAGRGPGGDFQALQQQIEDLRRALDEMRREMRRGSEGRDPARPKDGPKELPRRGSPDNAPERTRPAGPEKPAR